MDPKTIFLNSLYDEQMGFFCAHEYSENLEEMLKDELNVKQFNLFKEWRESEAKPTCNHCSNANSIVNMKLDRLESILEKITYRLEAIEEKQTTANTPITDAVAPMNERIIGMEKILGEIMTRFEATEQKTSKVNDELTFNVNSLLEQNKKTEVFQENLIARMKEIEQCVKQTKEVSNPDNSGKSPHALFVPTRQEKPEEPKRVIQPSIKKETLISLQCVEITNNYSYGNVHVKRGEVYGLLKQNFPFYTLVNISSGKTIGNVRCFHCEPLYVSGTKDPKMVNVNMPWL